VTGLESAPQDKCITAPLVIHFDLENYPILPSWDDDDAKPLSDVKALLTRYFDELWSEYLVIDCLSWLKLIVGHHIERTWPCDNDMLATPWDAIKKEPNTYFDTTTLPAGVPVLQPEALTRAQVYMLVEHIHSCQSATHGDETPRHFLFRSKAEIQETIRRSASHINDNSSQGNGSSLENKEPAGSDGATTLEPRNTADAPLGDAKGNGVDGEGQEIDAAGNGVVDAGPGYVYF
jgi:hypothetical protein